VLTALGKEKFSVGVVKLWLRVCLYTLFEGNRAWTSHDISFCMYAIQTRAMLGFGGLGLSEALAPSWSVANGEKPCVLWGSE
jgi:hypothetical protein